VCRVILQDDIRVGYELVLGERQCSEVLEGLGRAPCSFWGEEYLA